MGLGPFKRTSFKTSVYATTSTMREAFMGMLRIDQLGRKFRYARAGASDLAAGKLGVCAAIAAAHVNEAILTAAAIGTQVLDLTVTTGTAILANELAGGFFVVNDATGEGYSYVIAGNTAMLSGGTTITIALAESLRVALDTTSEFTLVHSRWNDVIESATLGAPAGVPLVAVTAAYYYWAQTGGLAAVLITGTPAAGALVQQCNAVAGAVEIYATGTITYPPVGFMHGIAGVDTEYYPVELIID